MNCNAKTVAIRYWLSIGLLVGVVPSINAQSRPPVGGVYLTTRFNSGSGSLEKNVFYFAPNGVL